MVFNCRLLLRVRNILTLRTMEKIHQLHRELKFKQFQWAYSKYYDYPDGQDLLGKLSYTTKMTLLPSSILGYIHGHNFEPVAVTNKERLYRMLKFMVPGIGMAVVFTTVTYFSTNIRKKDDPFNYFLGGMTAGSVVGFLSRRASIGLVAGLIIGSLATMKKSTHMSGTLMFPPVKSEHWSSYYARNLNWSLLPDDIRGNWTRDPPPEEK